MLQVKNLDFSYKNKEVLKNVSFDLNYGQSVCLLGKNGVGKSTLFKCLLNFIQPKEGMIFVNGKNLHSYSRREISQMIAYIPQKQTSYTEFTVIEMVLMGTTSRLKNYQQPGKKEYAIAKAALEKLTISHLANHLFSEISGGEQQLVIIARSVAQNSKIIIMDEPCANLDYGNQLMVLEMIKVLCAEGYLIIQATHDPNHAFQYATYALVLQKKEPLLSGKPRELLTENILEKIYQVPIEIHKVEKSDQYICLPKKK